MLNDYGAIKLLSFQEITWGGAIQKSSNKQNKSKKNKQRDEEWQLMLLQS